MIISASRRTDIPAFYFDWFIKRLKEGYVMTRNPYNYRQVSKINLEPEAVDCIVFWTSNPENMLDKLKYLREYEYYFQFTLTGYGGDIEKNLPEKDEIIKTFQQLATEIGKERIIWRYDPILLAEEITENFHYENFAYLAEKLQYSTEKCIISFLDEYKKIKGRLKKINYKPLGKRKKQEIAGGLKSIAGRYGLELVTCAEEIDLSTLGISRGKCIDDDLIARLLGSELDIPKDSSQREACRCARSVDIGVYNTCRHGCLYCYASGKIDTVREKVKKHSSDSPLLVGRPEKEDVIREKNYS
ncbi:MAG: DUF1848 domain-containing protein [Halanaerobiales bacterium]